MNLSSYTSLEKVQNHDSRDVKIVRLFLFFIPCMIYVHREDHTKAQYYKTRHSL